MNVIWEKVTISTENNIKRYAILKSKIYEKGGGVCDATGVLWGHGDLVCRGYSFWLLLLSLLSHECEGLCRPLSQGEVLVLLVVVVCGCVRWCTVQGRGFSVLVAGSCSGGR